MATSTDGGKDYKSAVTEEKVSVKRLRALIETAKGDLTIAQNRLAEVERELNAIIEEIGEEW